MSKKNYPNIEFPRELDICLTNQCNLNCDYCYFANKKYKKPDWLTMDDIKRAFDLYLKHINPERVQKISLTGGEPFLNFPLLSDSLKFARKSLGAKANIEIFTNGTLLSPRKAEVLLKENPMLIISMDGGRKAHDAARKFYDKKEKSVFDIVYKNIRNAGHNIVSQCYCGVTFCGGNIKRIYESIDFLLSLGFKGVRIDFDVLRMWKMEEINEIREEIIRIKKLYAETVDMGFGDIRQRLIFDFIIPSEELKQIKNPRELREISLAPDKCFYPSGLVATYGSEKEIYRVGDIEKGFDYLEMNKVLKEVRDYFSANEKDGYNGCPTHIYFAAKLNKKNPDIYFDPGEKFYNVLKKIADPISDFENMLNFLASKSGFGNFDHKPKHIFDKEIESLKVDMSGAKFNMSDLRNGCDLLLYSQGKVKRLIIKMKEGDFSREKEKALIIYALMRAKTLSKELKIDLHFKRRSFNEKFFEFAAEHGLNVFIDLKYALKDKEKSGASSMNMTRGELGFKLDMDSKNYDSATKLVSGAPERGMWNMWLEFNASSWDAKKSAKFAAEFEKFIDYLKIRVDSGRFIFISNIFDYLSAIPANCAISNIEMSDEGKYYAGRSVVGCVSSGIKREFFHCEFGSKNEKCVSCFKSNFYGDISNNGIAALIIFRKGIRKFASFALEKSKSDKRYEKYVKELITLNNDCSKLFKSCYEYKEKKH